MMIIPTIPHITISFSIKYYYDICMYIFLCFIQNPKPHIPYLPTNQTGINTERIVHNFPFRESWYIFREGLLYCIINSRKFCPWMFLIGRCSFSTQNRFSIQPVLVSAYVQDYQDNTYYSSLFSNSSGAFVLDSVLVCLFVDGLGSVFVMLVMTRDCIVCVVDSVTR